MVCSFYATAGSGRSGPTAGWPSALFFHQHAPKADHSEWLTGGTSYRLAEWITGDRTGVVVGCIQNGVLCPPTLRGSYHTWFGEGGSLSSCHRFLYTTVSQPLCESSLWSYLVHLISSGLLWGREDWRWGTYGA